MKINYIILILFTFGFCSCRYTGSGNIISENKQLSSFQGVEAEGPFSVEIRQGSPQSVVLEADDNLMKYTDVSVRNNILVARIDHGSFTDAHFKLLITVPVIDDIKASSAADVEIFGLLKDENKISLKTSSAGSIHGEVDAPSVMAVSSSGADINISGNTRKMKADASSGANIKADHLLSEQTDAEASSGASVHVHASVALNAHASSGGNVTYRGGGNVTKSESSGGGVEKGD